MGNMLCLVDDTSLIVTENSSLRSDDGNREMGEGKCKYRVWQSEQRLESIHE